MQNWGLVLVALVTIANLVSAVVSGDLWAWVAFVLLLPALVLLVAARLLVRSRGR